MSEGKYLPALQLGTRVQFIGQDQHPHNGQMCIVIGTLPNPSRVAEHQWYDVRFDDSSIGRFLERYLVKPGGERNAA